MILEYNGERIDAHSQRILLVLSESSPEIASNIAARAGIDETESVRYRLQEYLIPAGLAETSGRRTVSGGKAILYSITDEGRASLECTPYRFAEPTTVDDLREEFSEFQDRLKSLEKKVEKESQRIDNRATRHSLERTHERVETILDETERLVGEVREHKNSAHRAVNEAEERLQHDREATRSNITTLQKRTKELNQRLGKIEQDVTAQKEIIEKILDRASERKGQTEHENESLFDKLSF